MERKKLFKKYRNRLIIESLLRSAICGFAIGFFVSIIPAIITIVYNANGLWYCLAVGLGVGAIATALFYFIMFRPTDAQVANRIDRLGLQERTVTMMELEKDESFMANVQRQNAQEWIKAANPKKIKFNIFLVPLIILAVMFVGAVTMTTVSATSVEPPIEYNSNVWTGDTTPPPEVEFVTVTYLIYENMGGDILEYAVQEIPKGSDAEPVQAVIWPGFTFIGWQTTDGDLLFTLSRTDKRVMKDMTVYAVFMPVGEPDPNEKKDTDQSVAYQQVNTILDGIKYYGDDFTAYYDEVKKYLTDSGESLTEEQRNIIKLYFDTLDRLK